MQCNWYTIVSHLDILGEWLVRRREHYACMFKCFPLVCAIILGWVVPPSGPFFLFFFLFFISTLFFFHGLSFRAFLLWGGCCSFALLGFGRRNFLCKRYIVIARLFLLCLFGSVGNLLLRCCFIIFLSY